MHRVQTAEAGPITVTDDFDAFFRVEHPRLVAAAAALTGDREVARDLAQEALLRAYRAWPSVGAMERPGAWCRRVLVNLAIDRGRRSGRERRALERLGPGDAATSPAPDVDGFWAAVRCLPERQRAAVVLHYVEDQPLDAIAEVLGVATGTVKASLHAARASLAARLSPEEES